MTGENLLPLPETRLPADGEVTDALAAAGADIELLRATAATHPTSSLVWARLSDAAFDPTHPVESYAYARVGYHRGLDALRRSGWRGQGPVPWAHEPNRGVLRALYALRRAAAAIGENDEVARLTEFLMSSDPAAIEAIESTTADGHAGPPTAGSPAAGSPAASTPVQYDPLPPTEAIVIRGED